MDVLCLAYYLHEMCETAELFISQFYVHVVAFGHNGHANYCFYLLLFYRKFAGNYATIFINVVKQNWLGLNGDLNVLPLLK